MSIFNSENVENSCPKCCKIALFALKFKKFSGGTCPQTPPEKFRLRRLRCPSPRKILLFHKFSLEALLKDCFTIIRLGEITWLLRPKNFFYSSILQKKPH